MTPEKIIATLQCPSCAAAGTTSYLMESGITPNKDKRLPQLFCPDCRTPYEARDGILDLAGPVDTPRIFSSQWFMEFRPLIFLYEHIWRPLVTAPFSSTTWEIDTVTDLLDLSPGLDLLDLACGPGNFTRHFAKITKPGAVVGADLSWPMLKQGGRELAKQPDLNIQLMRVDVSRWPFAPESFDRIHCAGALHLFPVIDQVFASIFSSLKPGGLFVGATYCRGGSALKQSVQRYISNAHGFHWFEPEELKTLTAGAGFGEWHHQINKQGIVFSVKKRDDV